jgi:GcrA cell cycle regulator
MTDLFWTEERIAKAQQLWNEGLTAKAIAEIFGSKKNTVISLAYRHRSRFPIKQTPRRTSQIYVPVAPTLHPDRVTRVTFSGAEVTMPRVPTIDGPAQG